MLTINWNVLVAQAYAEGYYEGRHKTFADGDEEYNPYSEPSMRYAYRMGYERGISAYYAELEE